VICSKCSSDLITNQNELIEALVKNNNISECLSCRRESRLNLLVSFGYLKDKFDKWILKKKSERILI
jgi:RNase P subunit RPR2